MAFENAQIQSTRNGGGLTVGYREDLQAGDAMVLSLTSTVGVSSVQWVIKGRPEGSSVGGAGPEPIVLAIAFSSAFVVDADDGAYHRDGTYVIEAVINPGSPGETRKTAILARLSGLTIAGPGGTLLPLRKMGGFESMEDMEKPNIVQGWKTQAIRWLEYLRQNIGGGGGGAVNEVHPGLGINITGTIADPIVNNTGVLSLTEGTNISITGPANNPTINATGGGGGGAANTLFRRSNIAAMVAIDTSGFLTSDAHECEVLTVGDFYKFAPGSTLVADGITVIASTDGLGQWLRMSVPNETFLRAKFWSVGAGGSDEAQGWGVDHASSDAVKLATMHELNRRLTGYNEFFDGWYPGFAGPSIHLTSAISTSQFCVLKNMTFKSGSCFPRIFADPVLVDGGASNRTITGYQAAGAGVGGTPNAERTVTISGLGTTPQYVAKAMVSTDGTKFAWITRQPATNQLAISQVRVNPALGFGSAAVEGYIGTVGDFVVGDHVNIFDMPVIPDWPFSPDVAFPLLAHVRIGGNDLNYFAHGDMGNSSPYIIQTIFGDPARQTSYELFGGFIDSGGIGFISQPLFTGSHNVIHDSSMVMYSPCSVDAIASPGFDGCGIMIINELNISGGLVFAAIQGARRSVLNLPEQNNTMIAMFGLTYTLGAFQLAPTSHHGGAGCDFYMDDGVKWYGSIPGAALSLAPGTRSRLAVDGITLVCPGADPGNGEVGQIILNAGGLVAGASASFNFSDVPIFDLQSGSSVAGHQ